MPDSPDALSVAFRAISFVLLLNAAGVAIFLATFGRLVRDSLAAIYGLGWRLAAAALVFVAGHQLLEAARMAGEMNGVLDPAMQETALLSLPGAAFAMRVLGLALVAVGLWRCGRSHAQASLVGKSAGGAVAASTVTRAAPLALAGAILAIAAFTLTGHTSVGPHRLALAVLLILHLLVVAFWLGALWPLHMATNTEQPAVAAHLVDAFSRVAGWVVPGILVAGVGLTALLLPDLSVFKQPYGQLLLTKIALFAVLMGLAAFNKWIFGPAVGQSAVGEGEARGARAFRRTVVCEYILISAVLAVTAAMTTFFSPEAA